MRLRPRLVGILLCFLSIVVLSNLLILDGFITDHYTTVRLVVSGMYKASFALLLLFFGFSLWRIAEPNAVDLPQLVKIGYEGLHRYLQGVVWALLIVSFFSGLGMVLIDLWG